MSAKKLSEELERDCLFCKIVAGKIPSTKVYEDKNVFAFLTIKPERAGHLLVVPKKHYKNIVDCPNNVLNEIFNAIRIITKDMKSFKIIQNNNEPFQEIFHLHFHIIPW